MTDLVEFLRARLKEDERVATVALNAGIGALARMLCDVETKQQIIGLCETETLDTGGLPLAQRTLRLLALPYADHPDYDERWRP